MTSLKGLYVRFQMTLHPNIAAPDSQRYLESLINNVEDIVVFYGFKSV